MTHSNPANPPHSSSSGTAGVDARRTRSLSIGLVDLAVQLRQNPETFFDVVIVGSGYGASVAAQQLAGLTTLENGVTRPISVCVLERGAEYLPGMFPSALSDMPAHVRTSMQASGRVMGNREGLFDVRLGADVSALVANGLGGGSLINAGVLLEPEFSLFKSGLPTLVTDDLKNRFLEEAKELLLGSRRHLKPNTIERHGDFGKGGYPLKFHRMQDLARGGKESPALKATPAQITVAMQAQPASGHSVDLKPCNGCGDCMTGCNVGAKTSLDTNLLAQAKKAGAQLVTGASVLSLRPMPDLPPPHAAAALWELTVVHTSPALQQREAGPLKICARRVILAAGALGSPEIFLRSRSDQLLLSSRLGEKFSCNGDNIAAIHRLPEFAHSTADEHQALGKRKVGPTITNMIKVPAAGKHQGFWIQEFAVPASLKRLFAEVVTTGQALATLQTADRKDHGVEKRCDVDPCAVDDDAMKKTLLVGIIGHDAAEGSLRLPLPQVIDGREQHQEGSLHIVWPQARYGAQLLAAHKSLELRCQNTFNGATVIANPMWRLLPGGLADLVTQPMGPVLTVHPLGGCVMGADAASGVVDEFGRVFDAASNQKDKVFDGLVVLDGSIVAGSLGANPSLTIAALALRAVEKLKREWGFEQQASRPLPSLGLRPIAAQAEPALDLETIPTKISVVERLWGHVELQGPTSRSASYLLELTLAYEPVELRTLMKLWGGRTLSVDSERSFVRLFHSGERDVQSRRHPSDNQRFALEESRSQHVVFKARLSGTLQFLSREKSSFKERRWRGFWAYVGNRGKRDLGQGWLDHLRGTSPLSAWTPAVPKSLLARFGGFVRLFIDAARLATRAGEVRRFDYDLTIGEPLPSDGPALAAELCEALRKQKILGEKRLTYSRRGNPWGQLTTLALTQFAPLARGSNRLLRLDAQYMVQTNIPLIELTAQQSKVHSLLDMASFGLFVTRIMLGIHLWSFRKPDTPAARTVQRLPGLLAGLPPPELTLLSVGLHRKTKQAITVRLTRYRPAARADDGAADAALPPLAMIHGYSASGTTFAHPTLAPSAARYFCDQRREVWVIDLRSSAGMPLATEPWAMEEIALVDIPAALMHIKNVSGQRVDVIGHCIGGAMLGMALLTDAANIRKAVVQLGIDTWITPAQLGVLAAFNGSGGEGAPHPVVSRVVLSQKGPLLRYTEENIFRAHLMRSLRRWLVPDGYQFEARADPGVADQLLDRLLASLHYDDADYNIENPRGYKAKTPWTATRHRVDALFGRVFAARNLSEETLNALDDFFGPVNIDTVSQTIHFVRFNCITNQRGRGEFVTLAKLRHRWSGIPTFAIHGAGNGLVDVSTQSLLKTNFLAAGVAFGQKTYPDMEHQDTWIGRNSETVFRDIEQFLISNERPGPALVPTRAWHFEPAWIGPRVQRDALGVTIHALSSPQFGSARLLLIPVIRSEGGGYLRCGQQLESLPGDSRNWLTRLLDPALPADCAGHGVGWLALLAYRHHQTTLSDADLAGTRGGSDEVQFRRASNPLPLPPHAPDVELDEWLVTTRLDLSGSLLEAASMARQHRPQNSVQSFGFALASCQYPAGLPDQKLAESALCGIADFCHYLDFAIFCGDQIYADATAGMMDPSRRDERYDLPLESAFRAEPMRRIARTIPIYTLLDDHEIVDNWEPLAQPSQRAAKKEALQRRYALHAFFKYQRMESRAALAGDALERRTSMQFDHGCASFFLLDTRSQRSYRRPGDANVGGLFAPGELLALKTWLKGTAARIRFIVTPTLLLPRRLGALNHDADHPARHDGWEGYPADVRRLLGFITRHEIKNVVFLSGDEHLGCVAHAELSRTRCGQTRRAHIVSIHASGLYAPFPFANAKPHEFVAGVDQFAIGAVTCTATAQFTHSGSLFANLRVACEAGVPSVSVAFQVNGEQGDLVNVLADRTPRAA